MKKIFLTLTLLFFVLIFFGQTTNPLKNGFLNFNEFLNDEPSLSLNFQLKKRTGGDVFMVGGIQNYRLKEIIPISDINTIEKEIWGVVVDHVFYINSYPYSKIKGYNQIIEKGYYTYFIGEPARTEAEQRALGIIEETEKQIPVCCKAGYVILIDGTIKLLRPELLTKLCSDNAELTAEIKSANLKLEDVLVMFDYLKKYNLWKSK